MLSASKVPLLTGLIKLHYTHEWLSFRLKSFHPKKRKRKRVLPFLQQHQGFQYHREVPENRRLPGVLRDLWDQGDLVDPVGNKQSHLSLRNGIHLHAPCSVKVLNDNTVRMRTNQALTIWPTSPVSPFSPGGPGKPWKVKKLFNQIFLNKTMVEVCLIL